MGSCSNNKEQPAPTGQWIAQILEYKPAPGQFINTTPGNTQAAASIVGKRGMVSLGGYGGYIIFRFEKPILNGAGVDFVIHGNAFDKSSEPGIVEVSVDVNGNGIADDEWYELKGAAYQSAVTGYEITYLKPNNISVSQEIAWSDNKGGSGALAVIVEHPQSYWPLAENGQTLKFSGKLIANPSYVSNNLWIMPALGAGYVDNFSSDYIEIIDGNANTQNSNKFDLSNATVALESADFVRVYNCQNEAAGILGEVSTEVCGAFILHF